MPAGTKHISHHEIVSDELRVHPDELDALTQHWGEPPRRQQYMEPEIQRRIRVLAAAKDTKKAKLSEVYPSEATK